jgi:hypothetical protein
MLAAVQWPPAIRERVGRRHQAIRNGISPLRERGNLCARESWIAIGSFYAVCMKSDARRTTEEFVM